MVSTTQRSRIGMVDAALDAYVAHFRTARHIDPTGFKSATLVALAGCTSGQMSGALQYYRRRQGTTGATRYVIAAQEYGVAARWRILAKPGDDPAVVAAARLSQARWACEDMAARFVSDRVNEISPALAGKPDQAKTERAMQWMADNLKSAVDVVDMILASP